LDRFQTSVHIFTPQNSGHTGSTAECPLQILHRYSHTTHVAGQELWILW